ncbi:MAG: HD domain-containing protein [Lachnospiraceae bacterium]|nr:HD domain-containing protein [Lachnospiraceae bacterium]
MGMQERRKYDDKHVIRKVILITALILVVSLFSLMYAQARKNIKDIDILDHGWEYWDGVRTEYVDLPAKGLFANGKTTCSFFHNLNNIKPSSSILYFKTQELDFKIFVDGKLIFTSDEEYKRFSNFSTYLVTLPKDSNLMEIRFDKREEGDSYNVPLMVCGSPYSIISYMLLQGIINYIIIITLFVTGFSLFVMYLVRAFSGLDEDRGFLHLGLIMMLIAFSLYPITDIASIIDYKSKASFYLDFVYYSLLPLALVEYIAYRAKGNNKVRLIHLLSMLFVAFTAGIIILDATNVFSLSSGLVVINVTTYIAVIVGSYTMFEEVFKKKNESMYFVAAAFAVLYLSAIITMSAYYLSIFEDYIGSIMVCLFIFCIICGYYEIKRSINNYSDAQKYTNGRIEKLETTLFEVTNLFESRDGGMRGHVRLVSEYTKILATTLKESGKYTDILTNDFIQKLADYTSLHDLGKISVSENIIVKKGKLDPDEYREMQTHTANGGVIAGELLSKYLPPEDINLICDIIVCHHEWWDGSGYPSRLSHEDIPLSARIVALADVLDALTSPRYYKKVFDFDKATEIIRDLSGSHFDPSVVTAYLSCREKIEAARARYVEMYE